MVLLFYIIVAAALVAAPVEAHSWVECANWRFTDVTAYDDVSKQDFTDSAGSCVGYARRFPQSLKEFGKSDEMWRYRHWAYRQDIANKPTCRPRDDENGGSIETRVTNVAELYSPNRDGNFPVGDGGSFGSMSPDVRVGDNVCWRWPGKNHAGLGLGTTPTHVGDDSMVKVLWSPTAGTDPSQSIMYANEIAQIPFRRCKPGRASSGDQTGVGSELAHCGGCFKVPQREPGTYLVQFSWTLNVNEVYSTCIDYTVVAGGGASGSEPTPVVSAPATTVKVPTMAAPICDIADSCASESFAAMSARITKLENLIDDMAINAARAESTIAKLEKGGASATSPSMSASLVLAALATLVAMVASFE